MKEMAAFGSEPFTISQLHTRLTKERPNLRHTPIHAFLSHGNDPSIQLGPCLLPVDASDLRSIAMGSPDSLLSLDDLTFSDHNSTHTTTPTTPSKSPLPQEPRVLLAVSLGGNAKSPDVESRVKWLSSEAPSKSRRFIFASKPHS
jgi:hypothetical protein